MYNYTLERTRETSESFVTGGGHAVQRERWTDEKRAMSEVICKRLRIRTGSVDAVREWARTISAHRNEALETLRDESVQFESVFLEHGSDGDYLVYYMRGEDLAGSRQVARRSKHPIDEYHQRFMNEHIESGVELETLVDLEFGK